MDNIRNDSLFGNSKVIVGSKYADLILETLGKVYVKTGNSSRLLNDVFKLLDNTDDSGSSIILVGSLLEMESMEYPGDGYFVFNTLTKGLYLSYDNRYVLLIEAAESADLGYVRKSGDTMTGLLEIVTKSAPLIVASSKLVLNFNAEYINGFSSDELAKKALDEYITGNWTFNSRITTFNSNIIANNNVRVYKDIVTSGSIGSPEFASGFGGYGWRFDATTNTLTTDYLVVRKAMRVYEMVINKISATNGSLWVSNSSKCTAAYLPKIITLSDLLGIGTWGTADAKSNLEKLMPSNNYFLFSDLRSNYTITETFTTLLSNSNGTYTPKSFVDYNFIIYIKDITVVINSPLFKGPSSLYDLDVLDKSWADYNTSNPNPSAITEKVFNTYKSNIKAIFVTKSREVVEWSKVPGDPLSGTEPSKWDNVDSFNKRAQFFIVPTSREVNYKKDGKTSSNGSNVYSVYPYYKYFGLQKPSSGMPTLSNIWVVECKNEDYPYFKPGDIIRCLKYNNGNIKYYDAIVTTLVDSYTYIMQKAQSVFDTYTEISYDDEGNLIKFEESYNDTQYNKTEVLYNSNTNEYEPARTTDNGSADGNAISKEERLDDISKDDNMILMGNIYNIERQNAVYITSTDDCGPYIDVLSGLNRPDYSVLYVTPTWDTKKASIKKKGDIYVREDASDFYYQTTNPGSVNPDNFGGKIDKKHPLIFLKTKDKNQILINDGEKNQITLDILNNPEEFGYFLTEVPTMDSALVIRDNEYKCTYTKITKVRLGNLSGIHDSTFGDKQPYGYGLYGGNVFLTGEFYLNNGNSVVNFSEELVLIKFKNAGISINKIVAKDKEGNPIVDEEGNPTYELADKIDLDGHVVKDGNGNPVKVDKTEIVMTANLIKFKAPNLRNNEYIGLFGVNEDGTEAWLDVQGSIKAHGLYIYPENYTPNDKDPLEQGANVAITPEGNIIMKGTIYATAGQFGSINIGTIENKSYWGVSEDAKYIIWQKAQGSYGTSLYARAGFKLGIGKYKLFDAYPAFLEIYNYSNSLSSDDNMYGIKVSGHMNAAIWASVLSGIGAPNIIPAPSGMVAGFFDGTLIGTGLVMGRFGAAVDNQYPGYYSPSINNYSYYPGISFNFGYDLDSIRLAVRDGIIIGMSNDSGREKSYVTDSYGRRWVDSIPGSSTEVRSISLNYTSLTINLGNTRQLTATISPSSAAGAAITWTSSNELIATVSNGTVYALNVGSVTITAEAGGRTAKCDVVVSSVRVTGISVSPSSATMTVGDTRYVYATISPSNATNKDYRWITSDSSVASVTSSGYVSARSSGKATITAIAEDGGHSDNCVITVNAKEET